MDEATSTPNTKEAGEDVVAEDVTYESDDTLDDSVVAEESAQETIKKLRDKLKKTVAEKQEYLLGWQKDKAEFLNARKRDTETNKELQKYAKEDIMSELLPVLQSFNMAFGNKESWEKVDKNWRVGVEYIASQLKGILSSNGLKEVDPLGLPFDPLRDEAVEFVKTDDEKKDHVVVEVIQKGYELTGKIISAPKVKVGEYKA